ncbi:MAG TPA: DUF374 domain-containing protein [Aquabacterium sp.]|uniref:lysophospholipid acyltransferase family protein n=1 Tax=Aquabacterium sp. TaxID=1872578 RepID=UPI002E31A8D8|nr:DUF374 domain-containing protein [Aquabacterium sp.]HEX5372313.1 DUF374 domain-containing protein [Aquabacterium sp.]
MKRAAIQLYGVIVASLFWLVWRFLRFTVRVRHVHAPPEAQATVDCAWHEALMPYFLGAMPYRRHYVWMNHPAWYMKGIHIFLKWVGVRTLVLGSSGHGGRQALQALIHLLRQGASTFLNPDGPYGPAHVVKDGVLDLAEQSGVPVVAIHVRCHRAWRIPTWDRKWIPQPGSRVELIYSPPWVVTPDNREAVRRRIESHLQGWDLSA